MWRIPSDLEHLKKKPSIGKSSPKMRFHVFISSTKVFVLFLDPFQKKKKKDSSHKTSMSSAYSKTSKLAYHGRSLKKHNTCNMEDAFGNMR
jgi:hypothetical protein